jgi:hypothetical protein
MKRYAEAGSTLRKTPRKRRISEGGVSVGMGGMER